MAISDSPQTENQDLTELLEGFLRQHYDEEIKQAANEGWSTIELDWMDLYRFDHELADDLIRSPETVISHARRALRDYPLPVEYDFANTRLAIVNLQEQLKVGQLSEDSIGTFVSVVGQVGKLSQPMPKPDTAVFECQRCGTETSIPQPKFYFQEPYECHGCERQGPFKLKRKQSDWTNLQQVRLKRSANETAGGRSPTLDVTLRGEQCVDLNDGRFGVGSRIGVTGVVDIIEPDNGSSGAPTGTPVLRVNGIEVYESDFQDLEIGHEERQRIESIAVGEEGEPYEVGVDSLAPTHHGDDLIKEAILLQMFAGVTTEHSGTTQRGNIHVLVVGDPGTGKSELMERVAEVAPNARFTDGKGTSKAGITAAAVPSDFGDEKWDLEAGVLPLSDNGVACIDEIDKADEAAIESMHRAMAQQVVSVDKADIHAELRARAAVLAAGNPTYGRFDEYENPQEQLDLGPTILSRFDLIFPLSDQPSEESDRRLATELLEDSEVMKAAAHGDVDEEALERVDGPISDDLLTKWAAYARQNVFPSIPEPMRADIRDRYVELRQAGYEENNPIPVTVRVLKSLQRLAEASARVRLSDTVQERDVDRGMRLLRESIEYAGTDEEGNYDADVVETNLSQSQKNKIRKIQAVIKDKEDEHSNGADEEEVISMIEEMGYNRGEAGHGIEKLKKQGEIYEPSTGFLRTT